MAGEDLRLTIGADIDAYQNGLKQAGQLTQNFSNDVSRSLAGAAASTDALGGSAMSASMKFYTMRSGVSAARDGVMAFTLGGQAAERSLLAMGHHITSLVNETGSFKGALGALASSLWGPGGLILGITLAVELFDKFGSSSKGAAQSSAEYIDSLDAITQATIKGKESGEQEITRLKILYDATQNHTLSLRDRNKAYDELEKKYPNWFSNAEREKTLLGENKKAYDDLSKAILASALAKAYEDQIGKNAEREFANQNKITDLSKQRDQAQGSYNSQLSSLKKTYPGIPESELKTLYGPALVGDMQKVASLQKQINDLQTDSGLITKQNLELQNLATNNEVKAGFSTNPGGDTNKNTDAVTGLDLLKQKQQEFKTALDDAVADNKPAEYIKNLAIQYTALSEKISEVEQKIANSQVIGGGAAPLTAVGTKATTINGKDDNQLSTDKLTGDDIAKMAKAYEDYVHWLNMAHQSNADLKKDNAEENLAFKELSKTVGQGLVGAFEAAMQGTQSFVQAMGKFLEKLIEKLIAAAAAAAVVAVLMTVISGGSFSAEFASSFGQLSGLTGVIGSLGGTATSSLPQHANGGIATSASIGIFGEAGPEALIPLNRMNEFTGGGGGNMEVTHRVSGSDLLLVINRATKTQGRKS